MNQNGSINLVSVDSFKSWLIGWLGEELAVDHLPINPAHSFLSYGMDSVQAMSMVGDLEAKFGRRLPPTLAWDYPTIDALAEHLADRLGAAAVPTPATARPEAAPDPSRIEIESLLARIEHIGEQEVDRLLAQYLGESS
jgi:acyl carrier protein